METNIHFNVNKNRLGKYEVNMLSLVDGVPSIVKLKSFSKENKANEYKKKMELDIEHW